MLAAASSIQAQQPIETRSAAPAAQDGKGQGTRLILLGTAGGPIIRKNRSQPAHLLTVDGKAYLIDAGDGVSRQLVKAGYQPFDIKSVFLTHLHMDHVNGLAPLLAFNWVSRRNNHIAIFGPPGTKAIVDAGIAYSAVPEAIFELQFPPAPKMPDLVKANELGAIGADGPPATIYQDDKIRVSAVENSHYSTIHLPQRAYGEDRSYSYRFDTPDLSIVFTGDTGASEAVTRLAKGADILVTEVIDLDKQLSLLRAFGVPDEQLGPLIDHMKIEHITPEQIGAMATAAGVKKVILTHVVPGADEEADLTPYVMGVKKYYKGPVILGRDLDKF
ncbi:hypothetical protein ASE00_09520 [Sphingomonas sp. Root710]|nr:hypothetical protein ASE00_09520 [Sphingomonas sp. Root710]